MSDEKQRHMKRLQELLDAQHRIIPQAFFDPAVCADVLWLNQAIQDALHALRQAEAEHEIGTN